VLECRQCGRWFDEEEVYLDDAMLTFCDWQCSYYYHIGQAEVAGGGTLPKKRKS